MGLVAGSRREQPTRKPRRVLGAAAAAVARRPGRWLITVAVLSLCSVVAAWLAAASTPVLSTGIAFDDGWTWQSQQGTLELGVTHTDSSLPVGRPPAAVKRAEVILRSTGRLQNQHLMGWAR